MLLRVGPPVRSVGSVPVEIPGAAHEAAYPLTHGDRQSEAVAIREWINSGDAVLDPGCQAIRSHHLYGLATKHTGFTERSPIEQHLDKAEVIGSGGGKARTAAFEAQRLATVRYHLRRTGVRVAGKRTGEAP